MPTVPLRKRLAGSDSYGHAWPEDGSVIDVDYEQAMDLLAIPDAGFTVADQPTTQGEPAPEQGEFSEVEQAGQDATDIPAKRPYRRRTPS
ncbi:hypothetical protein [Kitasatospora sp. NBC_01302]|uniref:hypothetical protein n=1 Tax=Kitasatospora sp. NBC_01302 TaxID=2903575 RepID=UPI002E1029AE|nr:hypothetical protein OG294_14390 [Kitasatospora sp. NBC_01302]